MKEYSSSLRSRLQKDVIRYMLDYGVKSPVKLFFIVDFWPVLLLRIEEQITTSIDFKRFCYRLLTALLRPLIQGFSGSRIFQGATIGSGLLLHASVGVVITSEAVIGENCTIFSGVAVVHKANGANSGAPVIGKNVKLMSGCKIVGPVIIGDGAVIGANAVVLADVPAYATAVGIPARVIDNGESNLLFNE